MAIVVETGAKYAVAGNAKTDNVVTGDYEFTGPGVLTLVVRAKAAGLNVSLSTAGASLVNDKVIPFTGTAGNLSVSEHVLVNQEIQGGKVDLSFRNTTTTDTTVDFLLDFTPSRRGR